MTKKTLYNHEIATIAVFLLNGELHSVDTEDVALKMNQLAPGRFTWKKYTDQINLEIVRVFLSDAKKPEKGAYLLGSGSDGWMLTEAGLQFVKKNKYILKNSDLSRKPLDPKEKRRLRSEKTRMLSSEAYYKYLEEGLSSVTLQQIEAFFRIDDYINPKTRQKKIERIINLFGDDSDLGSIVREFSSRLRQDE